MYTKHGYVYDDENLALIPQHITSLEGYHDIISKYSTNKGEYKKMEKLMEKKKAQIYTMKDKFPIFGGIAVTYDCQLRCSYCANSSEENNCYRTDIDDVTVFVKYLIRNFKIRKLIDNDIEVITIYLTGAGEPTYDWSLFCSVVENIRRLCKSENVRCRINLTTNGILTDTQLEYICHNIDVFMVSFDGLPDIQNKSRRFNDRSKSSDIVLNTLKKLDKFGANYTIRSTLWHADLKYIKEMFHFIYGELENFREWSINIITSTGRASEYSIKGKQYDVDRFFCDYIDITNEAIEKYNGSKTSIFFVTNSLCGIACGLSDANTPFLYPNKNLHVCIDAADLSPNVGYILDGKVILNESYSKDFFYVYYDKYFNCKDCIAFRFCAGGCPINSMRENNLDSVKFECEFIKKYYEYIFNRILEGKEAFGWYGQKRYIKELNEYFIQITNHELELDRHENKGTI